MASSVVPPAYRRRLHARCSLSGERSTPRDVVFNPPYQPLYEVPPACLRTTTEAGGTSGEGNSLRRNESCDARGYLSPSREAKPFSASAVGRGSTRRQGLVLAGGISPLHNDA